MELTDEQFSLIKEQFKTLKERSPFYAKKFEGIDLSDVQTQEDFEKLPFSEKADLREAYPLGLAAVPEEKIVRIHSSSGTTGIPVVIPYTQKDVDDWATMFSRCYETVGITNKDRIHITPGYGLWTAGIGFQLGAEKLGAMAVPLGPGNTEKQLTMMEDLQSTVLCATSSYALLLAEAIAERGIRDKLALRKGVIGSVLPKSMDRALAFLATSTMACICGATTYMPRSLIRKQASPCPMARLASWFLPPYARKAPRLSATARTTLLASFRATALAA